MASIRKLIIDVSDPNKTGLVRDETSTVLTKPSPIVGADTEVIQIYPVEPSGITNSPWKSVDWSGYSSLKLSVGLRSGNNPSGGTWKLADNSSNVTSALAVNVSASDLQTRINADLTAIASDGGMTVSSTNSVAGQYYMLEYSTAGAKSSDPSGSSSSGPGGEGLTPYGTVVTQKVREGTSTLKERWLVQLKGNELVTHSTWSAVSALAASVTVVSAGSGSTTGVQTFDFSRPAIGGVFSIVFNSVTKWFDWNATVAQVQDAFGTDYAVTGDDGGPWTIEKVAVGAVGTGTMDVTNLDALAGWQGTVKMNTTEMVLYMLSQTDDEVTQYLEIQHTPTAEQPFTAYQDEVTVSKDVINI